ncbi:hypothetical protein H9I32_11800 [Bacillus sp. Xin]|nr:hypothetical protein [Bacillus sp. Xin]NSW37683.1 hypothetical protein [Bacillus sp. Xin1]
MDPIQWRQELEKEITNQSDRAIAIIVASILEIQLKDILKQFMIKEKDIDKDLFEGNSALSNFSSKIKACYYLGLISQDEYKNLDRIRKIRNMFAHQIINISFENNQSINDTCQNLYISKNRYMPKNIPFSGNDGELPKLNLDPFTVDNSPKNKFVEVFHYLSTNFLLRVADLQMEGYREKYEIKKSIADEFREKKEKILRLKEQIEEQEAGPYIQEFMRVIDMYDYIADVLENSYDK